MNGTSRRDFLGAATFGAAALATAGCASVGGAGASGKLDRSGRITFSVFADIHYNPGYYPHSNTAFLGKILDRAKAEKANLVIQLGDFNHHAAKDVDYNAFYKRFSIPTYHVIGNHDDDGNSHEQTLAAYGMKSGHYFFDSCGFRFIILDPNYVRWANGKVEHYSNGNYYKKNRREDLKAFYDQGGVDVISVVPPEQVAWFKEVLAASPYPCVIASHQSMEREYNRCNSCSNALEIRTILEAAERECPGKVALVMNGHHHMDYFRVLNGIRYFDVNSASFQWMGSHYKHDNYPKDYQKEVRNCQYIVGWDSPLNAIVTLTGDGHLKIDGSDGLYTHGVTPEMCKFGPDGAGRRTHPSILSIEM